mgnify:CR=1 FL=1
MMSTAGTPGEVEALVNKWAADHDNQDAFASLLVGPMAMADMAGQLFVREFELNARGRKLSRRIRLADSRPPFLRMKFLEAIKFFTERFGQSDLVLSYRQHAEEIGAESLQSLAKQIIQRMGSDLASGASLGDFLRDFSESGLRTGYLENVYRTNVGICYGAGRVREIDRSADPTDFVQYRTVQDNRVRPEHAKLDEMVWSKGDPAWRSVAPPNGWQCRCVCIVLDALDVKGKTIQEGVPGTFEPDEGFGVPPTEMVLPVGNSI